MPRVWDDRQMSIRQPRSRLLADVKRDRAGSTDDQLDPHFAGRKPISEPALKLSEHRRHSLTVTGEIESRPFR